MSLKELLLTLAIISVIYASGFSLLSSQIDAMTAIRQNNLVLYTGESLRNAVLSELMKDFSYNPELVEKLPSELGLPLGAQFNRKRIRLPGGDRDVLEIVINTHNPKTRSSRVFKREVFLP